jgi:hypothetical protein
MVSLTFNYRLGTSFAAHKIRSEMTVIFTYTTVFSIPLFSESPCSKATFLSRKSKDPERRYYISSVVIKGPDIILSD